MRKSAYWFGWGVLFVIVGGLFFLLHRRVLVVFCTWGSTGVGRVNAKSFSRQGTTKDTKVFFLKNGKWCFQEVSVVWDASNDLDNLAHLTKHWLSIMAHEGLVVPTITVQSIALAPSGSEAYVSFSETPFGQSWSIYRKWQLVESLLKTIVASGLSLSGIRLLVDHKDIRDDHLDLSYLIPVQEFLSK